MTNEEAEEAIGETLARSGLSTTEFGAVSQTIARRSVIAEVGVHLPQVSLGELALDSPDKAGPDLVVIRELGSGGMGVVHLAEQRSLQREVAVKTVRRSDEALGKALVREGRLMGASTPTWSPFTPWA